MRTPLLAIVLLVVATAVVPAAAKVLPCPGGRFLVAGDSMTGALDGAAMDVVDVAGKMISIASGCGPVKARVRATARGTKIRARWPSCAGLEGKAVLNGTITEYCRTLSATFVAKSAGVMKPVLAALSACGDGIWDPEGGEECDAGLGPCGALCNACTCAGVTTTTVTATTSPTTSAPDTTSTTTTPTTPSTTTTSAGGGTTTSSSTTTAPTFPTTSTTSGGGTTTTATTTTHTTTTAPATTSTTSSTTTTHSTNTTSAGPTTSSSTMPTLPTTSTTTTTLMGPDLAGLDWMSPSSAPAGANAAVQYSVKNFGTGTAVAPWYDYLLFSTDPTFGGDTAVAVVQRTTNTTAGGQYTVIQNAAIPKVPPGTYYLYLQTDPTNAVPETNESNNITAFVPITVTAPELIPTAFTAPGSATAGSTISVSYTVKNQGSANAFGPWTDRVFLSADATFGGDTPLNAFANVNNLGLNGTYSATVSVTLPMVAPGTYRLFFQADDTDAIYEGGQEANNVRGPLTITIN